MGFLHDKRSPFDFPPGVPPGQQGRGERDQFGLLINSSFLCETMQEFNERMAATETFARDAADAVMRQVGRKGARALFLKALRPPPPGRQPDEKANARLLEAHDRQITFGVPARRAARAAAKQIDIGDVDATAKHIRTLVKERAEAARRAEAEAAWRKKLYPSLIFGEDTDLK
jgi:hypothetical protein